MKILALEFSSPRRSVAIGDGENAICRSLDGAEGTRGAFDCVHQMLAEAGIEREQIGCVAVGLGPGSYAGIRSAVALARGWQLARGVTVRGFSSTESLAAEARRCGIFGNVSIVVDAQRGEFYLAGYSVSASGYAEKEPLQLASLEDVRGRNEIIVGPEVNQWFPTGHVLFPSASTVLLIASANRSSAGEVLEPVSLRETNFVKAPPARRLPV